MKQANPPSPTESYTTVFELTEKDHHGRPMTSGSWESADHEAFEKPSAPGPQQQSPLRTALLVLAVLLSILLPSLDRTIISTAIPQISKDFDALSDVGWYGSAYLLTFCALQMSFGRIYTFFSVKSVLLGSVITFEAASMLCGTAPNSTVFIIGRAISGVGAGGITTGCMVTLVYVTPMEKRPLVQGLFGAFFGLAAVLGPLAGGLFTSSPSLTWRWCFYINLPIGVVAVAVIALFLHMPVQDVHRKPLKEKLVKIDIPGSAAVIGCVVCIVLALDWGGQTYAWNDGVIIALLVLTVLFAGVFVAIQVFWPENATLPPRILKQRSMVSSVWASVFIGAGQYIFVYFLPMFFQLVSGISAAESGTRLLATLMSVVVGSMSGGYFNMKIGYYTPLAIVGSFIMVVGAGLLTTLQSSTPPSQWIGYQILYGLGYGWCFQAPSLVPQVVLPVQDVATGISLTIFVQLLGSAIFLAVGENVLSSQLVKRLSSIPGIDTTLITPDDATTIIDSVPESLRDSVLSAYSEALRTVFQVGLVLCCLAVLGIATLEWKSCKKPDVQPAKGDGVSSKE